MIKRFIYHYRRTRSLLQRGLRSLRVRGLKASLAMLSPNLKQSRANSPLRFPSPVEIQHLATADFRCEQPAVSLIIPVHNKLELTQSCLASLLLHKDKIGFEVIVVDDASSDASFEFLSGVQGLRVYQMSEQSGYVLSSNKGAELARGETLVFLNNDTIVQEHWLENLLDTFQRFPDTGIAGAKLLYPNGRLQEAGGAIFRDGSVWNKGRFENADNARFSYVCEVGYVSGAVLAMRKHVFDALKGFDPHFAPGYFEDTDLAMRVRTTGLKIRYQAFSHVVHIEGGTSGTQLDSGMKAFQIPHQKKFAERWKTTLAHYPTRPQTELENKSLSFQSDKKKILLLDEHTPKTNGDSGSLRLFHMMKSLQNENCDLHFLPADLIFDSEHTSLLQQQGIACYYKPWTKSAFDWLKENAHQFDVIIVCRVGLMSGIYDILRTAAPKAKLIFDTVDLHHIREAQEAELSKSESLAKQAKTTKIKEYALIEKCDETWVVSETECLALQKQFPEKIIRRVSNIHPMRFNTPLFSERKDILFVGNFRHPPNADGLQWFIETIWPLVHNRQPDIRLNIVGTSPPGDLVKISEGMNIVFHGHVDDIEKIIDASRINIAPLRYGAGAKGKISQALASGLPSIATTIAADGMHLTESESVMLADNAEAFVNAILILYADNLLWKQFSKNGYAIAEAFFSEQAVANEIKIMLS
jgi:O-antigen biosynthesis protein